ncbi:stage V sporulation protein D [Gottschalkia purinilytica]|uniref:Stage V sporulation protein D n=1 Tax=Gottschalkia purinilytica TaxID=1503 RepID=A0A0L0WEQ6_GOTPU|nr:stage V sporulation protein D [Gottschalkia purinilytica]KNF09926.1 stage V sporulation protein D [Gottschalkia purinilytica]
MSLPTVHTKKRLILALMIISVIIFALIVRIGYLQVVKGEELKKQALEQWTRGIPVKAKRGVIYDRNGKKLAISINKDTVWCRPADVKKSKAKDVAKELAKILDLDENEVYKKITSKQSMVKIKQWIDKEESETLRKAKLSGIEVTDDNKRYYPNGAFASHIIGHTNIDQVGQYGIEKTFNKYLTGIPGKWVKTTDAVGRQLPYDHEKLYEAKDGLGVGLTLDETIQHFAEKAVTEAMVKNKAKNATVIVMEPKTGDILAMASKPDYNPNNPKEPTDEALKKEWEKLSPEDQSKKWYDMWRNFPINDNYEPGSTFKIITTVAGLEENKVTPQSEFYCTGYVTQIKSSHRIKCVRYYNPHGRQTLVEGVENSCNIVFVDIGLRVGKEKMYEYIKAFGFGEPTGISLTGETAGIIPSSAEAIKDVNLATISFGQGIAITPIQLITAVAAVANGGNLMQPRIVKELRDQDGKIVHEYKPEVRRKVISEKTSKTMMEILESVVTNGGGEKAYVPGYRVAGKTGTAQKVADGRYAPGKYIASFIGVAPADDPKLAVLVIIDEPMGQSYYGGTIAAPIAGDVIKESLEYLNVKPKFNAEEKKQNSEKEITVPDLRNKKVKQAGQIILDLGLDYNTDAYYVEGDNKVISQFPSPGTKVNKGSTIDIYVTNTSSSNKNNNNKSENEENLSDEENSSNSD